MNYKPVIVGNQSNGSAGTKACNDAGKARMETLPGKDYILLPVWTADPLLSQTPNSSPDAGFKPSGDNEKKVTEEPGKEGGDPSNKGGKVDKEKNDIVNSTNNINTTSDRNSTNKVNAVSSTVNATGIEVNAVGAKISIELLDDPNMPELEDIVYLDDAEDVGAEADMNNLNTFIPVSPIPSTRIHKDHLVEQIIGDWNSAPQTRRMIKNLEEHGLFSSVQQRTNHKDFQNCLFACFLSQEEPKTIIHALQDPSWIEAMQDELLQFKLQKMDVKSAFIYGKIEEEVYVCQPLGFEDPDFPNRVYKLEKVLYGLHQAPKAWYETLSTYLLDNRFQRGKIDKTLFIRKDKGLQVKQKEYGIFISQDKYVTKILKKFGFTDVKTASTPMETQKPLLKDEDMCACARYQVNPKVSHLNAMKRIFRYLKGQPKLGLWYPKDSPFDLVAYTDSDYAEASLDRKSTTGGCQFLRCRLISWQCKKQTVVANSTTEVEYVTASSCCGQVLWVQNQLLDYGYNFIHTKIYRKSTTGGYQFLRCRLISWQCKKQTVVANSTTEVEYVTASSCCGQNGIGVNAGDSKLMLLGINLLLLGKVNAARHNLLLLVERYALSVNTTIYTSCIEKFWATVKVKTVNEEQQLQALVDRKKIVITEAFVRRDLQLDDEEGTDCLPNVTIFEELTRMATKLMFKFSKYIFESMVKNLDSAGKFLMYPRLKKKWVKVPQSSVPSDPTNVADDDSMTLKELMDFCTKLQRRVLDLENTKTAQAQEITILKKREDASKQGRKIYDIDDDIDITLVNDYVNDQDMFDVNDLAGEEVFFAKQGVPDSKKDNVAQVNTAVITVSTASTIPVSAAAITEDEITLSQVLAELKSVKPKVTTATTTTTKRILLQGPSKSITTTTIPSKDKGKGIMVEEPANMKKKDQISFDEQEAIRLQDEFDKEERLAREKDKANVALIEEWNDIQAKI
ncbi:putative ribonuclease H-like domain-containing protein [Tanacetum coccineum]